MEQFLVDYLLSSMRRLRPRIAPRVKRSAAFVKDESRKRSHNLLHNRSALHPHASFTRIICWQKCRTIPYLSWQATPVPATTGKVSLPALCFASLCGRLAKRKHKRWKLLTIEGVVYAIGYNDKWWLGSLLGATAVAHHGVVFSEDSLKEDNLVLSTVSPPSTDKILG